MTDPIEGSTPEWEQTALFADSPEDEPVPGQTELFAEVEAPAEAVEAVLVGDDGQTALFGEANEFHSIWREWQGMPQFSMEDQMPWYQITVNFDNPRDLEAFGKLIGVTIQPTQRRTASIWYPPQLRFGPKAVDKRYRDPHDEGYWKRIPHGGRKDPHADAVKGGS